MVSLEKSGDGQEGEEAPVTSPPLELRRPGSVGHALSGRSNAVPHSLQSPHDRSSGKLIRFLKNNYITYIVIK